MSAQLDIDDATDRNPLAQRELAELREEKTYKSGWRPGL